MYYTEVFGSTTAYQVMAVVRYDVKDTGEWDFRTRNHEDMESYNIWMEEYLSIKFVPLLSKNRECNQIS